MATQEAPAFTLRTERNLVLVRVVVRDHRGQAVASLHKEDFHLFDNGKPQTISHFSVEGAQPAKPAASAPSAPAGNQEPLTATVLPQRFIGLLYDDVHASFDNLVRTRNAAEHYLATAFQPGERVGIFSSSGQVVQDFTDDRDKLERALDRLQPRPVAAQETCPDISVYQAHLIVDQQDQFALQLAAQSVVVCRCGGSTLACPNPQGEAEASARQILELDENQSQYSLRGLESLIRRMALSPGQRSIVLISPGFFAENMLFDVDQVIDRALRAGVVINTLDSQGLVAEAPDGDASVTHDTLDLSGQRMQFQSASRIVNQDVLSALASDTGGAFFHDNNDLDGGFRKLASPPGAYYVLAFSPLSMKYDGRFHKLKVQLDDRTLSLEARRGYYAPRKASDPAEQAEEDIREALFSQETLNELPVDVHTQFFKVSDTEASLSILAHLDARALRFRKQDQRSCDDLRFVSILFDRDGNYVTGAQKLVTLRLRDATLERLLRSGIAVKTSFKVKPGDYVVREVVRDGEGGHVSGLSKPVEIPF